jgi:5-methyltetrahydropteroyltriglutamate--homocysteine methyltransferase
MSLPAHRAEHVGSLLRPSGLTRAFRRLAAREIDAAAYRAAQDAAIREAIQLQERVGLEVVTDGEFRRASYWSHFVDSVAGLAVAPSLFKFRDEIGQTQDFLAPNCDGRMHRRHPISVAEYRYLAAHTRAMPKVTLPSPPTMHFWRGRAGIAGGYQDLEEFLDDLAGIYRAELADLAAAGCRYVQLDEVPLAMLCDPDVRAVVVDRGEDPDRLVALYVAAINRAIEGRPDDMAIGLHLCRGNHKGKFLAEGSYDWVAERMFGGARVDAWFLEYDTPRAGDFAPLRFVPKSARVVLGLISSKTTVLEPTGDLRRRLDEAARVLPLERLAISPQCGFASSVGGNPVTHADQEAKLRLVVDTARAVWGAV